MLPKGPTGLLGRSPPGLWRSLVYLYTNGHRSLCGLRDARKCFGVRQVLVLNTAKTRLNADDRKGIGIQQYRHTSERRSP